jgi:hypothetical protein
LIPFGLGSALTHSGIGIYSRLVKKQKNKIIKKVRLFPSTLKKSSHHPPSTSQPLKMELTEGSETSANYNLTPGKHPKEQIQTNVVYAGV